MPWIFICLNIQYVWVIVALTFGAKEPTAVSKSAQLLTRSQAIILRCGVVKPGELRRNSHHSENFELRTGKKTTSFNFFQRHVSTPFNFFQLHLSTSFHPFKSERKYLEIKTERQPPQAGNRKGGFGRQGNCNKFRRCHLVINLLRTGSPYSWSYPEMFVDVLQEIWRS